jgi:hypothetical protein
MYKVTVEHGAATLDVAVGHETYKVLSPVARTFYVEDNALVAIRVAPADEPVAIDVIEPIQPAPEPNISLGNVDTMIE